jgi:hypothetical protein
MVGKDKIKRNKLLQFLLMMLFFTLIGCKSAQKLSSVTDTDKSVAKIVEKTLMAEPQFHSVDIKKMNVQLHLSNQKQYNSPASCKIISDSVIHISVQPFFGIEMFVARFTPNTFIFIDKTKSIYYQSDYAFLNTKFNLDINFSTLRAIFTNKLFVAGENQVQPAMFINKQDKRIASGLHYENEKYAGIVMLNPDFRISDVEVNLKSGPEKFNVRYADFGETGKQTNFPYNIDFSVSSGSKIFSLAMSITRLNVDEAITIPELNLHKYRQGNISTLLK